MISSSNDWEKLRTVIVGRTFTEETISNVDLSFRIFHHDNIFNDVYGNDIFRHKLKKQDLIEHNEDIENFCDVLRKEGVRVLRPDPPEPRRIRTPHWTAVASHPLNIRDQVLIIGSNVIETAPQIRSRYFENDYLKRIFMSEFVKDFDVNWICAPKPMMLDKSFDISYVKKRGAKEEDYPRWETEYDIGNEIMFDAAQMIRLNNMIYMNVGNINHFMGFSWIYRVISKLGYDMRWEKACDNHIDSTYVPLTEDKLLVRPDSPVSTFFDGWEIITAPKPNSKETGDLLLASEYIDINVLSLDRSRVIYNEEYKELGDLLYKKGFEPIPVKLRHRRKFGGGFHCITLDLERKDDD